ncbi:hypothetical protein ACTBNI_001454 [Salmonella enterica subsp. enterica serovar Soerenga]
MDALRATTSTNFSFLAEHDPLFLQIATAAENAFSGDPNTTLIKLRQLGEALAQHIAALVGLTFDEPPTQADLLYRLNRELKFEPTVLELFHLLRIEGNKATHQFKTKHKEALDGLKVARALAIWFHQSFGKQGAAFKPGAFIAPPDPSNQLRQLQTEIDRLKSELTTANIQLDSSQQLQNLLVQEKSEYEALALAMDDETKVLASQAKEQEIALEQLRQQYEEKLKILQAQLTEKDEKQARTQRREFAQKSRRASQHIALNEELTRILIDQNLNDAGWLADSQELTWANGTRPEKGINKAIAEWPTEYQGKKGRADYVLFCGLTPLATVEAKKENTDVAGKIPQAERYSKGFKITSP